MRIKSKIPQEGIFAVYKPKGPTSHDLIDLLRKLTGVRRIGHAGTLDPLAEGVLVVGIGREATKKLHKVMSGEKEYIARIRLGQTSATDDEEGEKRIIKIKRPPTRAAVLQALQSFQGEIDQTPPAFSAVKIKGRAAYKYARAGKIPELRSRKVFIKNIRLLSFRWPFLRIRVITGPGVYIRSLARDLGDTVGAGGYLAGLKRIRVGSFSASGSLRLPANRFVNQKVPRRQK